MHVIKWTTKEQDVLTFHTGKLLQITVVSEINIGIKEKLKEFCIFECINQKPIPMH